MSNSGHKQDSAKDLSAEIGVDMEVFPSAAHLASWVSPGNNESAGKKNSHTNHGNKQTKAVITEYA
ncbi:transposase [Phocaeicola barnesiae]|uniref:transposase n=1 Tax=Phocaeicola barnesiae TaxID=376804 RepID=UPI003C6E93B4